jgi:hypothetical protein
MRITLNILAKGLVLIFVPLLFQFYELGCSVYVTKPVVYNDFIEAIRRLGMFLSIVKVPREDERF